MARALALLLFASIHGAQAQELRAAPPAEPGVLKRAPDTVSGVEVSTFESGKGWIGFGSDAASTLVERGEVLVDTTLNDYRGSGGFRRQTKNIWNNHFSNVRGLSERVRNALPYKIAPQLLKASDVLASVIDPLLVGDGRGAVSGAVDLGVTSAVSTAGTASGEWLGTVIGGTVGSWVPVVGNVVGATIGGAVGGFAGGYLAGAGYESFLKGSVIKGVEAGIALLVDPDPLVQKMQAHEAALYRQLSPELVEMIKSSQSYGSGELQLQDWGRLVTAPAPGAKTPPQAQAALPPAVGALLPDKLQFPTDYGPDNCTIASGQMRCEHSWSLGNSQWYKQFTGTVSGSTVIGTAVTIEDVRYQTDPCSYRLRWTYQVRYDFEDGGRVHITATNGAISLVANSCPVPPKPSLPPGYAGDAKWTASQ